MVHEPAHPVRDAQRDHQQDDWHRRSRRDFHRRRSTQHARRQASGKNPRTRPDGKAIVFGLLDRETGKVRTSVVGTRRKHHLHAAIRETVEAGAELNTDALKSYNDLDEYTHKVVDHAETY